MCSSAVNGGLCFFNAPGPPFKPTLAGSSVREENFLRGGKLFCHQKTPYPGIV